MTVRQLIEDTLVEHGLEYSHHPGSHGGLPGLVVALPGERKLKTNTILSIGAHSVRVEAFVANLFDDDTYLSAARFTDFTLGNFNLNYFVTNVVPADPRKFGLRVSVQF